MNRQRISITSVCLAFLVAACSSGSNSGSSQGGTGGNSSDSTNASGGSSSSSSSVNPGGGSSSTPGGGSSSNPGGGSSVTSSGGTSKAPNGGTSTSSAGTGGKAGSTGGTSASASGTTGGTGGNATTTTTAGGATTSGGSQAGGTGPGGNSGTGGKSEPPATDPVAVTSTTGAFWKTEALAEGSGTASVTVNETAAQTWDGFGGAFNEMGWNYLTTDAMKEEAIKLLFSKEGCNFAWGRIPIGASDYGMDRYTLNENSGDTSMSKFSVDRDKKLLIPYIQAALKMKSDLRFWASPWTPPTWMKTTPCSPNSGKSNSMFDGCVMKGDDTTLKAFALYLVKWIQAYEELGIKIKTVAPQNEPNYEQNYPSCHWNTADYPKFIGSYLGPALETAGLATKVMDGTLSNATGGDADIGSAVLKDATAKKYCNAIGVQWGMADAGRISTLKGLAGDIPVWISETQCGGQMNTSGPAPNDMAYGKDTWGQITRAIKAGVTAYNAWNMVLDKNGMGIDDTRKWPQNALLVAEGTKITQTPAYYVYRHFSQFADVGAKVLGTSGGDAIAFKNPDNSYVVVMYNSGAANSKYTVSVAGKTLQFSMPGNGWATIKYSK